MDKIVIYGLGRIFKKNVDYIEKNSTIVGYCDIDPEKVNEFGDKGVTVDKIKGMEFDYLLVTIKEPIDDYYLADLLKIDVSKIRFFSRNYHEVSEYTTYSECAEDLIVDNILSRGGKKYEDIHYIDLGVMSPCGGDNTYYFYRRGSSGVLVEADSNRIETIKAARGDRDIVINKAIYEKNNEKVMFYRCVEDAALSSLDSSHTDHWEGHKFTTEETIVETMTVNSVLELLKNHCDILSVDIEGFDYKALNTIDFERFKPTVIVVEMLDSDWCKYENMQIYGLLINNGYVLYTKTRPNGIFVDKDFLK